MGIEQVGRVLEPLAQLLLCDPPIAFEHLRVELPALATELIGSNVTLINANDDGILTQELGQQATYPQPLLIIERVTVLGRSRV